MSAHTPPCSPAPGVDTCGSSKSICCCNYTRIVPCCKVSMRCCARVSLGSTIAVTVTPGSCSTLAAWFQGPSDVPKFTPPAPTKATRTYVHSSSGIASDAPSHALLPAGLQQYAPGLDQRRNSLAQRLMCSDTSWGQS